VAQLSENQGIITVELGLADRIFAMRREISVSGTEFVSATVVEDGLEAARGIRAPGLSLPGVVKIGTWRRDGEKTFVSVRRNRPALSIEMAPGSDWERILIACEAAGDWATRLDG